MKLRKSNVVLKKINQEIKKLQKNIENLNKSDNLKDVARDCMLQMDELIRIKNFMIISYDNKEKTK